jgi:hypothetical protein
MDVKRPLKVFMKPSRCEKPLDFFFKTLGLFHSVKNP